MQYLPVRYIISRLVSSQIRCKIPLRLYPKDSGDCQIYERKPLQIKPNDTYNHTQFDGFSLTVVDLAVPATDDSEFQDGRFGCRKEDQNRLV